MNLAKRIVSVILCTCMVVSVLFFAVHYTAADKQNTFAGRDSVVIWYADENMTDYISAMAVAFHEQYGIRVIPQIHSGLDYLESIYDASILEENRPDVYIISNEALEKAYLAGLAGEITDPDNIINETNFAKTSLDAVTYHGKKVGYPYYFETSVLLYNKTYIEEMAKNQLMAEQTEEPRNDQEAEAANADAAGSKDSISQEAIDKRVAELIPQTFDELLSFADSYDAPPAVEAVFKWDVEDIFYNYFFIGNYMNVGGSCGDDSTKVDIYNLDAIKAMKIYQDLNQFFSFEAEDVTYSSLIQEFIEGKLVFTTATSDIMKTLEDAAQEGKFSFEYGIAGIPDLKEELPTKNLSVTNTIVVNAFSDKQQEANQFASYLSGEASGSLYEKTGKISAKADNACKDEKTGVFFQEYSDSVPVPKMMVTSNLWVQLEITFAKVWNGSDVSQSLKSLSEMIMSQVTGSEYIEEYIEAPAEEESTVEYLDEEAEREAAKQEE